MSDLAKCLLCGCEPLSGGQLGEDIYVRHTENGCPVNSMRVFKISDWTKLMGRGEPVAWMNEHGETLSAEQKATGLYFDCETFTTPLYAQAPAVDGAGFGGQPLIYEGEQTALNKLERFLQYVHLTIDSMDSARVTLGEIHCEARELMKELNLKGEG